MVTRVLQLHGHHRTTLLSLGCFVHIRCPVLKQHAERLTRFSLHLLSRLALECSPSKPKYAHFFELCIFTTGILLLGFLLAGSILHLRRKGFQIDTSFVSHCVHRIQWSRGSAQEKHSKIHCFESSDSFRYSYLSSVLSTIRGCQERRVLICTVISRWNTPIIKRQRNRHSNFYLTIISITVKICLASDVLFVWSA